MKKQRETPQWLADKIVQRMIQGLTNFGHTRILEPSAGEGVLIDALFRYKPMADVSVDCIELNEEKYNKLMSKGYNAYRADFLNWISHRKYDAIIAAPPFINNSDVFHIQKMYDHLDDLGVIITLTTPFWTVNNETHQTEFREWLKDKNYEMTMLPDNTFIEKGKTVPTAILTIYK